jgi:RNA polymerase sigma factor (sigma-70 family)
MLRMNEDREADPTRQTLLGRLKDLNNQESWKEFFDTYWRLIYNVAIQSGLTDAEAQDVVQETVLSVCKSMPGFNYDARKGSFKAWLLNLTRWRIVDELRKRSPGVSRPSQRSETTRTGTVERVPDPARTPLESCWDKEWAENVVAVALERAKRKTDPKHYQVFNLYVLQETPPAKVARAMGVSVARVYLIKHRVSGLIAREMKNLEKGLPRPKASQE